MDIIFIAAIIYHSYYWILFSINNRRQHNISIHSEHSLNHAENHLVCAAVELQIVRGIIC